jgi:aminocarboxymuconate-semialdehyde decarboxylase
VSIDVHNHVIPESVLRLLRDDAAYSTTFDHDRIAIPGAPPFVLQASFSDPDAKLRELDANGLDAAVISIVPFLFFYQLDRVAADLISRATNNGLHTFAAAAPDRFRWMAHVPLAAPLMAANVLEEAARMGAAGVEIGSNVAGRRLDDAEFEPFWAAAEREQLPVMIHPAYNEEHSGLDRYYLQNVIGNLLETTIAVERLICSGTLDHHPGLRILLVHGGGYFPYQAGRLRHAATVRSELRGCPSDPWAYRGRVLVDTITHDSQALAYLVSRMGPENVLLGSDLPFDMAVANPAADLAYSVDGEALRLITHANASRLYRFATAEEPSGT